MLPRRNIASSHDLYSKFTGTTMPPRNKKKSETDGLLIDKNQILLQLRNFQECLTTNIDPDIIKARLPNAEKLLPQFYKIMGDIKKADSKASSDAELKRFETDFYQSLAKAQTLVKQLDSNASTSHSDRDVRIDPSVSVKKPMKLKPVDVPHFYGSYDKWPSFKQMFLSLVHDQAYTTIAKFTKLKAAVRGRAAAVIEHLKLDEKHYETALQVLTERYENKRLLLEDYMINLRNLGTPCTCAKEKLNAEHCERMYNYILQTTQALPSMGIDVSSWDPIIVSIAVSKFDKKTLVEWEDNCDQKEPSTVKELLTFLDKRHRMLKALEPRDNKHSTDALPKPSFPRKRTAAEYAHKTSYGFWQSDRKKAKLENSNWQTNRAASSNFQFPTCAYCNGNHRLTACIQFQKLSLADRLLVLKTQNLCSRCLKKHGGVCKSVILCEICSGKHHTFVHQQARPASAPAKSSSSTFSKEDNRNEKI